MRESDARASLPDVGSYDGQRARWRSALETRVGADDLEELEDHLDSLVDDLTSRGLTREEAFLVAVRRIGSQSELAADLAQEADREFWRHLVVEGPGSRGASPERGTFGAMLTFAVLAGLLLAVVVKVSLTRQDLDPRLPVVVALVGLFSVLLGWFVWLRRPRGKGAILAAWGLALALGALTVAYPHPAPTPATRGSDSLGATQILSLIHLPIVFLLLLGVGYLGDSWRRRDRWMDYIRFVGEWVIYLTLVAMGAQILLLIGVGLFALIGLDPTGALEWVVPAGFGGALVVTAWLVEAKRSMVENLAPVLTMVFSPLVTILLLTLLAAMLLVGDLTQADRGILILVDLLLVLVWALVLFGTSARSSEARPRPYDWIQLALLVSALALDLVVLVAMAGRIGTWGPSANKVAALGENVVIAANLVWSGWLTIRFLAGATSIDAQRDWQCRYVPVIGLWATVVVVVFPPLFGFQ